MREHKWDWVNPAMKMERGLTWHGEGGAETYGQLAEPGPLPYCSSRSQQLFTTLHMPVRHVNSLSNALHSAMQICSSRQFISTLRSRTNEGRLRPSFELAFEALFALFGTQRPGVVVLSVALADVRITNNNAMTAAGAAEVVGVVVWMPSMVDGWWYTAASRTRGTWMIRERKKEEKKGGPRGKNVLWGA